MQPTPVVRAVTYERDSHRCVCCGASSPLSFQHRHNGLRRERPLYPEGLTACVVCNGLMEAALQGKAYRFGWKVRRWVRKEQLLAVPVFYQWSGVWALLTAEGERIRISQDRAGELMVEMYGDDWLRWD